MLIKARKDQMMKIAIVTCMKNEGPFVLEWVAYNRLIGVTDFLVYTNDCSDGTDDLLDCLERQGIVSRLDNPATRDQPYQMTALKASAHHELVKGADWTFVCDVDEFLDIRVGRQTIPDLITATGNPMAISVTMRMMANCGVDQFDDVPVIAQFTRSHDPERWNDQSAIEVKTLTRRDFPLKFYGAHRPFISRRAEEEGQEIAWTDGSGRPVPDAFKTAAMKRRRQRFPAKGASNFAALNHYTLRALESYLVKSHRGDVNRAGRAFAREYWTERNDGRWSETRMLRHLPGLQDELHRLKALPGVAAAHEASVAAHRALIGRLSETDEYKMLAAALRQSSKDVLA